MKKKIIAVLMMLPAVVVLVSCLIYSMLYHFKGLMSSFLGMFIALVLCILADKGFDKWRDK